MTNQTIFFNSIEENIAWSITGTLPDKENRMSLSGSWTPFPKKATIELKTQSKITLFPIIVKSPEYRVSKNHLDLFVRSYRIS